MQIYYAYALLVVNFIMVKAEARIPSTLPELLSYADKNNIPAQEKLSQLPALEGQKKTAEAFFFNNPEIAYSNGLRKNTADNPDSVNQHEWEISLSQTLEIAGQQEYRREVAGLSRKVYEAEFEAVRNRVRMDVAVLYYRLLILQEKARLENEAVQLFTQTEMVVRKQLKAGEATRMALNLAFIERQLALNAQLKAIQELAVTKTELARLLSASADDIPVMTGKLNNIASRPAYTLASLNESLKTNPDLTAQAWKVKAAEASLMLQKAARVPDVTLGISYANDGPSDYRESLTTFSISVPLPLFQHNETEQGLAAAELSLNKTTLNALRHDQQEMLKNLWLRMESLKERSLALNADMSPVLERNKLLARYSRDAGETDISAELLASQQAVNAQRSRLDILLEYHITRLTLEDLAGWREQS
ncbi:TolC family protein [Enterobacter mori]|uniref:TolC family protein n=1 Tax=Enterobacter mori TaxID=539813 RepID=UPI003B83E922